MLKDNKSIKLTVDDHRFGITILKNVKTRQAYSSNNGISHIMSKCRNAKCKNICKYV